MKLTFKSKNNYNGEIFECTVVSNAESLDAILTDFKNFLRGSGFTFNGNLEIVDLEGDND